MTTGLSIKTLSEALAKAAAAKMCSGPGGFARYQSLETRLLAALVEAVHALWKARKWGWV